MASPDSQSVEVREGKDMSPGLHSSADGPSAAPKRVAARTRNTMERIVGAAEPKEV